MTEDREKLTKELIKYGIVTDASWTTRALRDALVKIKGIADYKIRLGDRRELTNMTG